MTEVKVYKVCVPSYYAWPPGEIILKISYTREDAENYIKEYPNVFLRPWLTIKEEHIDVRETD